MKTRHRFIYSLSTLASVAGIVLIGYVFWMYEFQDNPPITFDQEYLPVVEETVKAGGIIHLNPSGCRNTNVPVVIYYSVIGASEYNMPAEDFVGRGKKGDCFSGGALKSYFIPEEAPTGTYHLHIKMEYKVNNIVTRYVLKESTEFEVVN